MCSMMHTSPHAPHPWLFPVIITAPVALTAILVGLAVTPALAMTISVVILIVALAIAEHARPFEAAWRTRRGPETWTDIVYIATASLPDRLTRIGVEAGFVMLLGMSVATDALPLTASTVGVAALAFLVADLGKYLIHRASHEWSWLWPFHIAHHQPSRLSALNALRLHPINMAYNAAIDIVPVILLGVPPHLAAVFATLRATVAVVQHANLDLERGRQWLVNAPSLHRTHHAIDTAEGNHNFASTLLIWDHLLGTLLRQPAPARVGVASPGHRLPTSFIGQLLYPVCRSRLDTTCIVTRIRGLRVLAR